MHVVTRKHLSAAAKAYPDAAAELGAWLRIVAAERWRNFLDLRAVFGDADAVDGYVIFNVRHNRYRLVTIVHYARQREGRLTEGHIYIRSFLTHRQYDNRANWNRGVDR